MACLDNSLADAGEYATGSTASEATAGLFFNQGGGMSETPAPAPGAIHTSEDEQILHKMGYAQELFRAMGGFQNFAISFTIISILAGCLTSYFIAFNNGGPVAITWGWLIVGLMSTLVALAMAEIASAYPTAGGLYYWSSKLGSPAWGWFTGWFNLVGQIAVTAAIGYGLAIFLTSLLDLWFNYPNTKHSIFLTYSIVMLAAVVLNMFKVSITAMLNTISAYWHMAGVAFIVVVLIIVPDNHQSVSYVFTRDDQQLRLLGVRLRQHRLLVRVRARAADVAVHDHGLRRLCPHGRGDAPGLPDGGCRHVHVGRRLRRLRLGAAARRHVRGARHPGHAGRRRRSRDVHLDDLDEQDVGRDPALHLLRRADVLPDGIRDVGVADDVRVLA